MNPRVYITVEFWPLFLVLMTQGTFLLLKLTETVAWSWLWVVCPLWALGGVMVFIFFALLVLLAVKAGLR